ncbi:PTS system, lactose-specific IIA component [Spiroplasma litorale]|uniref:PTS system lactose-specific EIIA component n=1 Tax=Spiroplasma litorale TaxID=216942 RepID=A0A0K1W1X8_9MOLU|nr:PTS lactose/cellobiose transporter subunit IIA [Spiroplasma litorale]AKX34314.1 PTS system, lactose-specific IIA component [Spiroplasma litorale]
MSDTKKQVTMKGLELVAYAGEARSYILEALDEAKNNNFDKVDDLLKEATDLINQAHRAQADMLFDEAKGNYSDVTITMVHGQDHLMTTILLKDIADHLIALWKK